MIYTNSKIYEIALKSEAFYKDKQNRFNQAIGFYLFTNLKMFREAAANIEEAKQRVNIKYQAEKEDGSFWIPSEVRDIAQIELNELSKLTQDLPIYMLDLNSFKNEELTAEEWDVMLEMIKPPVLDAEEEEE